MNVLEILQLCTKCFHHTSLEDKCTAFNCRERWWALSKLDRTDLIVKYFLILQNIQRKIPICTLALNVDLKQSF